MVENFQMSKQREGVGPAETSGRHCEAAGRWVWNLSAKLFSAELGNWNCNGNVEDNSSEPSAVLCTALVTHPGQIQKSLTRMIREHGSVKQDKTLICYLANKLSKTRTYFFPPRNRRGVNIRERGKSCLR